MVSGVESAQTAADWADTNATKLRFKERAVTGEGYVGLGSAVRSVARLFEQIARQRSSCERGLAPRPP